ncbi:uncharacterized protein VICG_01067 [Vittaforma corneae ATCC 50505]|uniref:DNA repair metallo-beta-lactamase domain-containing protein n=1 Tax=Vittaforma corneae (strain ATCC 50505) TaxID=993615 RepID=L2GLW5_VITCO|nr:uncharacterized protein VICG_01067 [Vittaforma corneae ATCC 50505]ELA41883.1 hypothetical protein VICG_01067 [Vittaforma corneae ATCC 50505]
MRKSLKNQDQTDISEVPVCKRILDSTITVDCFDLKITNCTHYFLSHFHADHYTKLNKSFEFPVFCSKTTSELVCAALGAKAVGLEMYTSYDFGSFVVRLIEANHCPGAVCFIFLINNQFVLHTGDFRYCKVYHTLDISFKCVYLDNTYQNFISFPSQKEAISKILQRLDQDNRLCRLNVCVLCCTYRIGKEKIFLSIAEYLNEKVQVTEDKYDIYKCYSRYTVDKINRDVAEIVNERRMSTKTFGFVKSVTLTRTLRTIQKKGAFRKTKMSLEPPEIVKYKNEHTELLEQVNFKATLCESALNISCPIRNKAHILFKENAKNVDCDSLRLYDESFSVSGCGLDNSTGSLRLKPFDRITTEEAPVKVISTADLRKLNEIASKIYADKIIVLCGSGWKEKQEYKTYSRMDGKNIKKGIEIVYFRYSEHSSSQELEEFKRSISSKYFINTVVNKPLWKGQGHQLHETRK